MGVEPIPRETESELREWGWLQKPCSLGVGFWCRRRGATAWGEQRWRSLRKAVRGGGWKAGLSRWTELPKALAHLGAPVELGTAPLGLDAVGDVDIKEVGHLPTLQHDPVLPQLQGQLQCRGLGRGGER